MSKLFINSRSTHNPADNPLSAAVLRHTDYVTDNLPDVEDISLCICVDKLVNGIPERAYSLILAPSSDAEYTAAENYVNTLDENPKERTTKGAFPNTDEVEEPLGYGGLRIPFAGYDFQPDGSPKRVEGEVLVGFQGGEVFVNLVGSLATFDLYRRLHIDNRKEEAYVYDYSFIRRDPAVSVAMKLLKIDD